MATGDLLARLHAVVGNAFVIERELAFGGMSRLFLATERSLDRQVVIKLLPPNRSRDSRSITPPYRRGYLLTTWYSAAKPGTQDFIAGRMQRGFVCYNGAFAPGS